MTVRDLTQAYLTPAESSPRLAPEDFFVLLSHVTRKEHTFLLAHPEYALSSQASASLDALIKRRRAHEPIAYLIGSKEFYGRRFRVTPATLIPRPETELLVESALAEIEKREACKDDIIDIGTGSGAIIITVAEELARKQQDKNAYYAVDISEAALRIAQANAHSLTRKKISFLRGDLLQPYRELARTPDHLFILANLPYLPAAMHANAMPDVRDYEPALALVSGADGLDHYRALLHDLQANPLRFTLFLEIDPSQAALLSALIARRWPEGTLEIKADLSGKSRLIIFRPPAS